MAMTIRNYLQENSCEEFKKITVEIGSKKQDTQILKEVLFKALQMEFRGENGAVETMYQLIDASIEGGFSSTRKASHKQVLKRAFDYFVGLFKSVECVWFTYEPLGLRESAWVFTEKETEKECVFFVTLDNFAKVSSSTRATKGHINNNLKVLLALLNKPEAKVSILHLYNSEEKPGSEIGELNMDVTAKGNFHTHTRGKEDCVRAVVEEDFLGELELALEKEKKEVLSGSKCATCHKNCVCRTYNNPAVNFTQNTHETSKKVIEFDECQKEVIARIKESKKDTALICAPGSGKTAVLVELVTQLCAQKRNVTAITFTNNATAEIYNRCIMAGISSDCMPAVSTLHSFALRVLADANEQKLIQSKLSVVDDVTLMTILQEVLNISAPIAGINYSENRASMVYTLANLLGKFKKCRNIFKSGVVTDVATRTLCLDAIGHSIGGRTLDNEGLLRLFMTVNRTLDDKGLITYDEVFPNAIKVLTDYPALLQRYHRTLQYILVDEYQDTSVDQHEFLMLFRNPRTKLVVIGDPYQAIYQFRGATTSSFLEFAKLSDVELLMLHQNYRSYSGICEFANTICNTQIKGLDGEENCVHYFENHDSVSTSTEIVKRIKKKNEEESIAVLTDTNHCADDVLAALRAEGISARLGKSLVRYDSLFLCGIYLIEFFADIESVSFLTLSTVLGMQYSYTTLYKTIVSIAPEFDVWSDESVYGEGEIPEMFAFLKEMRRAYANGNGELMAFYKRLGELLGAPEDAPIYEWLRSYIEEHKDKAMLHAFAKHGRLMISYSSDEKLDVQRDPSVVTVTTLHDSKGLEWDHVVIANVAKIGVSSLENDGCTPEYEQQRNMLYVGATRAKKQLYLVSGDRAQTINFLALCEPYADTIENCFSKNDGAEEMDEEKDEEKDGKEEKS